MRMPTARRRAGSLEKMTYAAIGVALAVHLGLLTTGAVYRTARRAWEVRQASALERSAQVAFGDDFARFVSFVGSKVPPSAKLVVPSKALDPLYGDIGLMQYFLRPRRIIDCPRGEDMAPCVRSMTGATTYLLAVSGFPPSPEAGLYRDLVPFDLSRGVYIPRNATSGGQTASNDDTASSATPASAWGPDLLAVAFLFGIGLLLARAIAADADWLLLGALSLPLGLAGVTWVVFLIACAGGPLSLPVFIASGLTLALTGVVVSCAQRRRGKSAGSADLAHACDARTFSATPVALVVCLVLLLGSLGISVGRSYSGWDDMAAYAIQGYGMAREGTLQASQTWGPSASGYPLNIQLAITAFHLLDGDVLPGSKLLFPFFMSAILLTAYRSWRRVGHSDVLAGGLMLALGTTSLVLDQSTTGYTSLPFTAYLLLGVVLVLQGMLDDSGRTQLLGGLMLAAAVWTRPEGWVVVWGLYLPMFLVGACLKRRRARITALVPIAGTTLLWTVFLATATEGGQSADVLRATLDPLATGNLRLDAIYWTLRYLGRSLIEPATWGLLLPGFLILLLAVPWRSTRQRYESLMLVAAAGWAGLIILGLFYVGSSTTDLRSWLGSSVDRMFLPAIVLGWVGVGSLAAPQGEKPIEGSGELV